MTDGVDANKSAIALAAGGTGGSGRSGSAVAMVRGGEGATFSALLWCFIYSPLGFDLGESILVIAGVLSFPGRSVSHLVLILVMNNLASQKPCLVGTSIMVKPQSTTAGATDSPESGKTMYT